jgi:hypothetical protein
MMRWERACSALNWGVSVSFCGDAQPTMNTTPKMLAMPCFILLPQSAPNYFRLYGGNQRAAI